MHRCSSGATPFDARTARARCRLPGRGALAPFFALPSPARTFSPEYATRRRPSQAHFPFAPVSQRHPPRPCKCTTLLTPIASRQRLKPHAVPPACHLARRPSAEPATNARPETRCNLVHPLFPCHPAFIPFLSAVQGPAARHPRRQALFASAEMPPPPPPSYPVTLSPCSSLLSLPFPGCSLPLPAPLAPGRSERRLPPLWRHPRPSSTYLHSTGASTAPLAPLHKPRADNAMHALPPSLLANARMSVSRMPVGTGQRRGERLQGSRRWR